MKKQNKSNGQYDDEYIKSKCFWGWDPAKYVKLAEKFITEDHKTALDIGAGEGKNSFFLAEKNLRVTGVEVSIYAINNFVKRMIELKESNWNHDLDIVYSDAKDWMEECPSYDIVVSYGMLHCLSSYEEIKTMVHRFKQKTKQRGLNIICTFLEGEPVPDIQKYLKPYFVKDFQILDLYEDWEILESEVDVIEHMHSTSKVMHKHTVLRLITRKNG